MHMSKKLSLIKISELAKLTNISIPLISKYFKKYDAPKVTRFNHRIVGVSPEAAEDFLSSSGFTYFYRSSIILVANICGGVGKTMGVENLSASLRRITNRDWPIILCDGDPQASLTSIICGQPADDNEKILLDFLEGKAGINEIVNEIGENIWLVKSNLNQAWIDRVLSKPQDIKKGMLKFYEAIFEKFGNRTYIFQDHTPQLSNLFASSICALNQLENNIHKAVVIPIRSDKFAIQGAEFILREINDINETFALQNTINIHCFFSNVDGRVSSTATTFEQVRGREMILRYLTDVPIQYCAEIPKSILVGTNVYNTGKRNKAAEDYQKLLKYIYSYHLKNTLDKTPDEYLSQLINRYRTKKREVVNG